MTNNVRPERFYALPPIRSLSDIKLVDVVTGVLFRYNSCQKVGFVNLGNDIIARIDLCNFSITKFPNTFEAEKNLLYKMNKKIAAKVIGFSDNVPILSRQNLQQSALDYLLNSIGNVITVSVETVSNFGAFVDIGNGIISLLKAKNYSATRFYDLTKILSVGDSLQVKLLDFDRNSNHFSISRKETDFKNIEDLILGNIYTVIPSHPVDDIPSGYFVEFSPSIAGILDVPEGIVLDIGTPVKGILRKIDSKGLKLDFRF